MILVYRWKIIRLWISRLSQSFFSRWKDSILVRIRSRSFSLFLANTQGAEVLYQLVKDSMKLDQETVVLDICCGTGTIGITLAKVIIINRLRWSEKEKSFLMRFRMWNKWLESKWSKKQWKMQNTMLNWIVKSSGDLFCHTISLINRLEIENIEFIADKIENVIHQLVNKYQQQRLVAILDPPRAGVRKWFPSISVRIISFWFVRWSRSKSDSNAPFCWKYQSSRLYRL